ARVAGGRADLQGRRPAGGDRRRTEPHRAGHRHQRPRLRRDGGDSLRPRRHRARRQQSAGLAVARTDGAGRRRTIGNGRAPVTLPAAIALALLAVPACAPKARYEPPPPAAVPSFKEIENWKSPQPRDADVRGAWWDRFADPALAALELRIDVSNQTLKAADAQFAQA